MKKVSVFLCATAVTALLASCASTKNVATVTDLNGEWNIIEINGTAVVPAPGQAFPYIGLDAATGRISGNSGCNRMMGSFDINSEPGRITFDQVGTTRMMCADMSVETNVLNALKQVRKYVKLSDGNLAFCVKSAKRPLMVLQPKAPELTLADLDGKWMIVEAGGETIPQGLEKQPFIELNVAEKRLHGTAGCNLINGGFQTEEGNATSIAFPQLISTMMACPDMAVESRVLKALNDTKTFGRLAGGGVGFYDQNGTLVMVLKKD